ncbi:MAG TPA: glycosyltransferase [Dongiaceae bacterium]
MQKPAKIVVLLTTYPLVHPRHGGQIRSAQVAKALLRAGFTVVALAIADAENCSRAHLGPHDIFFPPDSGYRLVHGVKAPYANDYLSGLYAASDEDAYRRICAALPSRIDAIILEQPWMLPVAQRLRADRHVGLLVYDAQNNETALKGPILTAFHPELAGALLSAINAQERSACAEADMVFAVSESDRSILSQYSSAAVVLAPNGVEPWEASDADVRRWASIFAGGAPRAGLYIASDHPPNFIDFFEVLGDRFGFLAPDEAIYIAGGASSQIEKLLKGRKYESLSRSRLRFLGVLAPPDLAAVKQIARLFVLPILKGSGSNLKTAEALFSGKWVVGTPMSFRGFERFATLPNAIVANPDQEFRDAIEAAMAAPYPVLSGEQQQMLRALTWECTLAPMMDAIASRIGLEQSGSALAHAAVYQGAGLP